MPSRLGRPRSAHMHLTVGMAGPQPCACGCGRLVKGQRRSCQFYSGACRVKFYRQKARSGATLAGTGREGAGAVLAAPCNANNARAGSSLSRLRPFR